MHIIGYHSCLQDLSSVGFTYEKISYTLCPTDHGHNLISFSADNRNMAA